MLIFTDRKLAFLATPKTGSTAIEMALRGSADIIFKGRRKHVNAIKFRNQVAPFMERGFGVELKSMALMRDPEDQLRSWFKYRSRLQRAGDPMSTEGMTFDEFITAYLSEDPPAYTKVGSQEGFLLTKSGDLCVDHLFQYERMEVFLDFLEDIFGKAIIPPVKNVSPLVDAPLSPHLAEALRDRRAGEFALYDRLDAAGGHLTGDAQAD